MKKISLLFHSILSSTLLLWPTAGLASEGIFGYSYTAETTPADNWEYEQKQTFRTGKARGSYSALDLRNEFEYGITDRLQGALYINSGYLNSTHQYNPEMIGQDLPDHNDFNINSISLELMYRILSPFKDGMGLALYFEPEISVRDQMTGEDQIERSFETKLILQKNYDDDQVITALNFMLEPEWDKNDGLTTKELWAEITGGVSYRFRANWFAGLEVRNHMEFVNMDLRHQEHSAYFAGPTVHYGAETYWWTLTVLPQVTGWPRQLGLGSDGKMVQDSQLHLGQHEKLEVKLAFGIPIGGEHTHEGHSHEAL